MIKAYFIVILLIFVGCSKEDMEVEDNKVLENTQGYLLGDWDVIAYLPKNDIDMFDSTSLRTVSFVSTDTCICTLLFPVADSETVSVTYDLRCEEEAKACRMDIESFWRHCPFGNIRRLDENNMIIHGTAKSSRLFFEDDCLENVSIADLEGLSKGDPLNCPIYQLSRR